MQIINGRFRFVPGQELARRGLKRQLGRVFEKNGVREHIMYCPICRKDMPGYKLHDPKTVNKLIREGRWDFEKKRMLHCGSTMCRDYHEEWIRVLWERRNRWCEAFYKRAQKAGLVA